MSVHNLKTRLADVAGIESLAMDFRAGRIFLTWGAGTNAYQAVVGAAASDGEIEIAIRNATALPPVALIPDKPTPAPAPAQNAATPTPKGIAPMSETNPVSVGQSVKDMLSEHVKLMGDIHTAQLELLRSNLARQRDSVSTAVGSVASKIAAQTDEFNAIMGQFTNQL